MEVRTKILLQLPGIRKLESGISQPATIIPSMLLIVIPNFAKLTAD